MLPTLGPATILLTPTAPGALTGLTHETGEIDERKGIETAKTSVGGVVNAITGTGTDEAGLARGPTGTGTERGTKKGTENAVTAVVTDGSKAKVATGTATKKRDVERGTKVKSPQN